MYKTQKPDKTTIRSNNSLEGETMEQKVRRILNNKEPIKDGAQIIHTEREDGVQPMYDIRTDRFEIAVDAADAKARNHEALRARRMEVVKGDKSPENGGAESTPATDSK